MSHATHVGRDDCRACVHWWGSFFTVNQAFKTFVSHLAGKGSIYHKRPLYDRAIGFFPERRQALSQ